MQLTIVPSVRTGACQTYFDGTYGPSPTSSHKGTIGNLTLAGDSTGINWGSVDNKLEFHSNGNGLLAISAFADDSFSGVNANAVFLKHGNITLNLMTDFGDLGDNVYDAFYNAFGTNGVSLSAMPILRGR